MQNRKSTNRLNIKRLNHLIYVILCGGFLMLTGCGQTLWPSEQDISEQDNRQQSLEDASPTLTGQDKDKQIKENALETLSLHRPIMTVYFTHSRISYLHSLIAILQEILPHRPDIRFAILAQSPDDASAVVEQTAQYAKNMRTSLINMGIIPQQITLYELVNVGEVPTLQLYVY